MGAEAVTDQAAASARRRRRRVLWACAAVVLLLLLALTPPLVSVNLLQRRIAASMSASLGRPVHLDRVRLHLLPVPGFTLENLVVSEDPAFGAEPVIRAMKVEVTLRPSSLWRRRVEIASIRFEVDDNGSGPSLNLVRNAAGLWNLESLLMHAAEVSSAPTTQARAGDTPRFPYIEATGGRVNVKLGAEKLPFSLVDADFALWLPTPEAWRVRLEGRPTRTDRNISDTGKVQAEGQLGRAARMGEVPVELHGSWRGAPMGEATRLLTGEDQGWRGRLTVEGALNGPLSAARLEVQAHLNDLRRADFVPPKLLDMDVDCAGSLEAPAAVVTHAHCAVKTPAAEGAKTPGTVEAMAEGLDLTALHGQGLRVGMTNVSEAWLMDWARLFSQRIPPDENPAGTADGTVLWSPGTNGEPGAAPDGEIGSWQGTVHGVVPARWPWQPAAEPQTPRPVELQITRQGGQQAIVLDSLELTPAEDGGGLLLSGAATLRGYSLRLVGPATARELTTLRGLLPPLGDGMEAVTPGRLDLTCTRAWGGPQSCVEAPAKAKRRR